LTFGRLTEMVGDASGRHGGPSLFALTGIVRFRAPSVKKLRNSLAPVLSPDDETGEHKRSPDRVAETCDA